MFGFAFFNAKLKLNLKMYLKLFILQVRHSLKHFCTTVPLKITLYTRMATCDNTLQNMLFRHEDTKQLGNF